MTLPIAVFVGVLVVILGAYYTLVIRDEDREQRKLRKRIRTSAARHDKQLGLVRDADRLSGVGLVARLLTRLSGSIGPVQQLIDQSGVKMTPGTFLLASGSAALVGFL